VIPTLAATERRHVETVLQAMAKGWSGVYVLGCLHRRVTVYSQQIRALELASALFANDYVATASMPTSTTPTPAAAGYRLNRESSA
jgi:hypothetical protein